MTNEDIAREILGSTSYVVLATASVDGVPWASPVGFAMTEDHSALYWVSSPDARHSLNVAARDRIALVAFDSTAAPYTGQGVYLTADAEQVTDATELGYGVAVFSRRLVRQGGRAFRVDHVTGEARLRLYRARVRQCSILDPDSPYDVRVAVTL